MTKDYESWSFRDRSFLFAVTVSLLWHFFWFFSVQIVVGPARRGEKIKPKIVSLGPVLGDAIFKTLVETKPQLSETFYRHLSDFSAPMELQVKTIERRLPAGEAGSPGEVVSVPYGKRFLNAVRDLLGGSKASPDYEFTEKIKINYAAPSYDIQGEAGGRQVLSRPADPDFPAGLDPSFRDAEVELEFVVEPSGLVSGVEVLLSSGNPDLDLVWERTLTRWQFSALGSDKKPAPQKGKIKFRFNAGAP